MTSRPANTITTDNAKTRQNTRRDFLRQAGLAGLAVAGTQAFGDGLASAGAPAAAATATAAKRYEYVFTDGKATVFDIANGFRMVETISLGAVTARIRGVAFAPSTGRLFVTYAGKPQRPGFVLCYDLVRREVVWREPAPSGGGAASAEVTPNGQRLFVPAASNQQADHSWHVLDTATGHEVGAITNVGTMPHDTVVGLDGSKVYMGALGFNFLTVGDVSNDTILRRVGPLGVGGPAGGGGVKPFTVNGRQTRAFINVNGLLGFEVGDLQTGRSIFRVDLQDSGFHWNVNAMGPSHGVSLSPDETEVWVNDQPNNRVHVFDIRGITGSTPTAPVLRASIRLQGTLKGITNQGEGREGWLQHSLDGRYVFVGDAGDVISTVTRKTVARLGPLSNSRMHLEIDWDAKGRPVATSTRIGLGRVV